MKELKFIKKNKYRNICVDYACLDCETSWNHDIDNPICWITSIQFLFQDEYFLFRKPSEFINHLKSIENEIVDRDKNKIVIYIHNASYDLSYLIQWLVKGFGNDFKMIAVSSHKIISFTISCFEFRCSYKLSNKSLNKWSKDLNTENRKQVGYYDYDKIIYQDNKLTEKEKLYDKMDVIVLNECLKKQFELFNDNVITVPITSTGYIRRIARNNFKKQKGQREEFKRTRLNEFDYKLINEEFSGGMTHGNRFYCGEKIVCRKGQKIGHRDFQSHYPSQQRNYEYPIGKPFLYYNEQDNTTIKDVLELSNDYCCFIEIRIMNVKLKSYVTIPFLQTYKLRTSYDREKGLSIIDDNGRVIKTNDCYTTIVLTNKDLTIINEQYIFDYQIINVIAFEKGFLPDYMNITVDEQYINKSKYKDIHKKLEKEKGENNIDTLDALTNLMKAKNLLNAIYGMSATRPIRDEYTINDINTMEWNCEYVKNIQEELNKYYNSYNNFMRYQWGAWCTSLARFELYEYIKIIGYENIIYCDTDSIFYFESKETEKRIEKLNKIKHKKAINNKAYVEVNNKLIYYDIFDKEESLKQFKFLHSKCYGYITERGEFVITIAGVTRDNGKVGNHKITREQEIGSLDNLKTGFIFNECGGTRAIYTDRKAETININGHETEVSSGCIIEKVTKTLSCIYDDYDLNYMEIEESEV